MAPDKQFAVDPKTLSSVTQMLTTPDSDRVMQGIELVRSLDDEALCEALLEGVVYEPGDEEENGRLVPNETFSGSDEEQPCLNLALLGLINHGTGATCTQFRETITTLATNCPTTAVLSNFTSLERLTLGKPPMMASKPWMESHTVTDEAVEVVKEGLSTCTALRWLCIDGMLFEAEEAGTNLLADREVVLEAVKQRGRAMKYADEGLRADREFVLEAVKQNWNWEACEALRCADDSPLRFASEELQNDLWADRKFVLEAVKLDYWELGEAQIDALMHAADSLRADREIVLEAVKKNGMALEYADYRLLADREIVLEAVKQDGDALEYADDSLKADREVVMEAVKQSRWILALEDADFSPLRFASEELQNDPEMKNEAGW